MTNARVLSRAAAVAPDRGDEHGLAVLGDLHRDESSLADDRDASHRPGAGVENEWLRAFSGRVVVPGRVVLAFQRDVLSDDADEAAVAGHALDLQLREALLVTGRDAVQHEDRLVLGAQADSRRRGVSREDRRRAVASEPRNLVLREAFPIDRHGTACAEASDLKTRDSGIAANRVVHDDI